MQARAQQYTECGCCCMETLCHLWFSVLQRQLAAYVWVRFMSMDGVSIGKKKLLIKWILYVNLIGAPLILCVEMRSYFRFVLFFIVYVDDGMPEFCSYSK